MLLFFHRTCLTKKRFVRNGIQWWFETIDMKSFVTLITDNQLFVIILAIFHTYFTGHILQPFIPFLCCNIGWLEAEISFALFGSTKTFRQGSTVHIKLVIECHLLILLDIPQRKDTNTNLTQHVPLLSDTVWLT